MNVCENKLIQLFPSKFKTVDLNQTEFKIKSNKFKGIIFEFKKS